MLYMDLRREKERRSNGEAEEGKKWRWQKLRMRLGDRVNWEMEGGSIGGKAKGGGLQRSAGDAVTG